MLKRCSSAYDACINGLALLSGILLALIPILIVYDAALRITKIGASVWVNDFSAIAIVYITFLAAPWLLREKGHVYVEVVADLLSWKSRIRLGQVVGFICAIVCGYLVYKSTIVVIYNIGQYDVSAIETPRWVRFLPLPIGFFFLSLEFIRSMFDHQQHLPTHVDNLEIENRSVV